MSNEGFKRGSGGGSDSGELVFGPFRLPDSKIGPPNDNVVPNGDLKLSMLDLGDFAKTPSTAFTNAPEGSNRPPGAKAPTGSGPSGSNNDGFGG
jgi:hypothetical protein